MAYDAFLKLDGIEGESNDKTHKGEIEISSYSWGVANSGSFSHGGGGGEGKATFQDLHFGMPMSKASPKLMSACATGKHIPSAVLDLPQGGRHADGVPEDQAGGRPRLLVPERRQQQRSRG